MKVLVALLLTVSCSAAVSDPWWLGDPDAEATARRFIDALLAGDDEGAKAELISGLRRDPAGEGVLGSEAIVAIVRDQNDLRAEYETRWTSDGLVADLYGLSESHAFDVHVVVTVDSFAQSGDRWLIAGWDIRQAGSRYRGRSEGSPTAARA